MGAIIGGVMQGVGAANSAYDEIQAQKLSAAEAADNKKLAWEAAANAIARGRKDVSETRVRGAQLQAAQKVAYANSGVDPTQGTAASTQANTAFITEMDARTQENNAAAEAWGFKVHGMKYEQQAAIDRARSSNRVAGHILGGAGGLAKAGAAGYDFLSD